MRGDGLVKKDIVDEGAIDVSDDWDAESYWKGYVEGAMDVWEKVKEQL